MTCLKMFSRIVNSFLWFFPCLRLYTQNFYHSHITCSQLNQQKKNRKIISITLSLIIHFLFTIIEFIRYEFMLLQLYFQWFVEKKFRFNLSMKWREVKFYCILSIHIFTAVDTNKCSFSFFVTLKHILSQMSDDI